MQNKHPHRHPKIRSRIGLILAFSVFIIFACVLPYTQLAAEDAEESAVFTATSTLAASVAVYDPQTKQFIYEKNSTEIRPLASVVKILTAIVAKDFVASQKYPTKIITLRAIDQNSRIDRSLKVNEKWNFNELLRFMLTTSSNTAAESLGGNIIPYSSFISLMNFKARNLGLNSFKIYNTSGLPINKIISKKKVEAPGAIGSAKDVALLMATAYEKYPELIGYTNSYRDTFTSKLNGKTVTRTATSTNELLAGHAENILGGKTGFTDASGGNISIVVKTVHGPIIIVVLGSTVEGRFSDIASLASSTISYYAAN
jgi:D-alanyl-D-alanine endopeptidase (penicillin-binding protein 7)